MTYALAIAPLAKMNPTIMNTTFRFGLPCQIAGLLVFLCSLAVTDGRAADKVTLPPEGSDANVSEARLSLAEARKTQSDPRTAVGHYGGCGRAVGGRFLGQRGSPLDLQRRLSRSNGLATVLRWAVESDRDGPFPRRHLPVAIRGRFAEGGNLGSRLLRLLAYPQASA